jgi:flagellar basal body rod protein FlgC
VRERSLPTEPAWTPVDLSAEIVALMSAKNQFSANLSTLKTANQIQKNVLDLMA